MMKAKELSFISVYSSVDWKKETFFISFNLTPFSLYAFRYEIPWDQEIIRSKTISNTEQEVKTKKTKLKIYDFFPLNFNSPVTLEASYKISHNLGIQQKKSRREINGSLVQMIINFREEE